MKSETKPSTHTPLGICRHFGIAALAVSDI